MRDRLIELIKQTRCDKKCDGFENAEVCKGCTAYEMYIKNADYLLANGVIVPPCKVGNFVYVKYYGGISNAYVTEFAINSKGLIAKVYIDPDTDMEYDIEDLFLTEEQAEQALKGGAE